MPGKNIADHHGSHRGLLQSPPADSSPTYRGVDAIVVPTFRRPVYLAQAAGLAETLGCALVTLHSGPWTSAAKVADSFRPGVTHIAIDVPEPSRLNLPSWETSRLIAGSVFARRTDVSAKRNLALMLCHLLGWSRILFLDDDITGLNPEDVRKASGLLDRHSAVGLQVYGFPDHSVVCHAYLQAGGDQRSFIGAGALVIGVQHGDSFFPDIYNDDWFFLLDGGGRLQPTTVTGSVIQQPYDPFRNTDRARAEEFGDTLAEGIYWLLDQDHPITDAKETYWIGALRRRRRFIEGVLEMVEGDDTIEAGDKRRRIEALKASMGRLSLVTPELCESYLLAWAADRMQWREHVDQLHAGQELASALTLLASSGSAPLKRRLGGRTTALVRSGGKERVTRTNASTRQIKPATVTVPGAP